MIAKGLGINLPGITNWGGTGINTNAMPHSAGGGPVGAGVTRVICELGPELFTPNVSGYITPNSALRGAGGDGGGFTQHLTVHLHGTEDSLLAQVKVAISHNNAEIVRHVNAP